ncbi:DNA recombination/repair protein RecA [Candidatus Parcubacteria bacterium]|nr:DNA recombination/repair protein RecA [Candidatus Parcubacteria bacterium]
MPRKLIQKRQRPVPESPGGIYFDEPKDHIQFIRSGCALLDCVLGGGWPLGRISNVVGDSSSGKTLLAIEAMANFFRQFPKGKCWYNEPEAAIDGEYVQALGIPFERVEHIEDCNTVEDLFKHLDVLCAESQLPKSGPPPGLYIVDSLDALSDEAERDREINEATYGGTKAKKLSEMFRRITQQLRAANIHMMVVSQVRDNIGVSFGSKHKRSGGKALDFYASQILWLAHLDTIKRQVNKVSRAVGVEVKAKTTKNKVGLPFRDCQFQITFGYGIEDEKASKEFLSATGYAYAEPLKGEALRVAVEKEWFRIERSLLPLRAKYAQE